MVRQHTGHIVVISSVQGKIAIPYRSACKFFILSKQKMFFFHPHTELKWNRIVLCLLWYLDAASKHATQAYFDCLRAEVERYGIFVTVMSPGYIRTNLSVNAVTGDGSKYGGKAEQSAPFKIQYKEIAKKSALKGHYMANMLNILRHISFGISKHKMVSAIRKIARHVHNCKCSFAWQDWGWSEI